MADDPVLLKDPYPATVHDGDTRIYVGDDGFSGSKYESGSYTHDELVAFARFVHDHDDDKAPDTGQGTFVVLGLHVENYDELREAYESGLTTEQAAEQGLTVQCQPIINTHNSAEMAGMEYFLATSSGHFVRASAVHLDCQDGTDHVIREWSIEQGEFYVDEETA